METALRPGLSARRKTICNFFSPLFGLGLVLILGVSACHEKTSGQNQDGKDNLVLTRQDSLNKPRVDIKVNRHYDGKGNVVGFDSTYTSFYSNVEGDTARMDSLMNSFDRYFKRDHSLLFGHQFNSLFFNDSTRYPDFFHNDFFLKRYELNDPYLRNMMERMDSIKNDFYNQRSMQDKGKDPNDL